ncbi:MAG: Ig-like domain-containing protein [Bacteroidetes bacterium]|nr:Ig-like domain-containing protein [Bacteroidota bacterium]
MKKISIILMLTAFLFSLNSCDKDDDPTPLTLVSLNAGEINLNGVDVASSVPVSTTIVATFSTNIDAATATTSNITLKRTFDSENVEFNITVEEKVITITPSEELYGGAAYELKVNTGLLSTDGLAIPEFSRSFITMGSFVPSGQIAYWNFEENANDIVGEYDPAGADIIDIAYVPSRNENAGTAASFNGSTSLIEIPDGDKLITSQDFSIVFWVKTDSKDKETSHFVMGCAGWYGFQYELFSDYKGSKFAFQYALAEGSASEDMWFPANADLGWQGWNFAKSLNDDEMIALLKDNWLHVVYTYNAAEKQGKLFFNGEKMKSFDFNLWPEEDVKTGVTGIKYSGDPAGNKFALGFLQGRENRTITDDWADYSNPANNHFKGQLDDIRIFHKAITEDEIDLMYKSEK